LADDAPRVLANRYEVLRVLGVGSSARTLLCTDLEAERSVAVKELRYEHLNDWKHLELFEREAKVLAMLRHPGIPEVYEFFRGEDGNGSLYLVQEFIEGASLKERMEVGPLLGEEDVFKLALGLLDVLEYLHSRAPPVLHRDIKPSNVILRMDGAPVLVDFGGVCYGWRPPSHMGTTVVGTSGYMPLEQLLGQAGPTSDLYALGATVLHLVTGTPPHEFSFDSGRIEVPQDLPVRDALRRLVEALLRPAPRDRPHSAAAARRIVLKEASASVAVAPKGADSVASSGTPRRGRVISSGEARFVNVGPTPRDPEGEFSDVYKNLIDPLFPSRSLNSPGMDSLLFTLFLFLSFLTIGILPLAYSFKVQARKRQFEGLFLQGVCTEGWIVSIRGGEVFSRIAYEFDVDGATYRGFMEYSAAIRRYWSEGDNVAVLYDPADPTHSCVVFR
jgi:serine/threonine protein kinase